MVDDEAGQRVVLAALLDAEVVFLVEILHLQAAREHPLARSDLLLRKVRYVVFVLDFAKDLLQHVLERNDARRTAELVDHHGDVRLVLDEVLQQQLQGHGLGDEIDLHDHVGELLRRGEET